MTLFRLFLILAWIGIAAITAWAISERGLLDFIRTFLDDLNHPWRAQFYADFEAHLLLVGGWMLYRERTIARGLLCLLGTLLLGALFSLPYILVASFRARGEPRLLLLGARA